MAEYNKVMTQIKPDLPKVIDTEQIYVYVPKASYDQAGIIKPDKTQFVIAGDYTLTIKHFTMTDDRVSVDVKMGYDNDTAVGELGDKDFVTKGNLTGYALKKLENNTAKDKAYIEGANSTGTMLVDVSEGVDGGSIVKRDAQGRIFGKTTGSAGDNELVNLGYLESRYVKKSGVANGVYTTDNTGADSVAQFSNNAIGNTMAYRASDGSLRGKVTTPEPTTLLNKEYADNTYIPVGSDGKIPNSYLPADIGADEIVSGYYSSGVFWTGEGEDWENSTWLLNDSLTAWNAAEIESPLQYFKDGSSGIANIRVLTADNVLSDVSVQSVKMFDRVDYESNSEQILRFAKENDESAGVVCTSSDTGSIWQYKVSDSVIYNATNNAVKQALRTIVFSQYPDYIDFQRWLKTNAVQIDGPTPIAGDPNKLYVDLNTNQTYRWDDASGYVSVGSALALGTSHDTAYYGDFGDKAYKHSQATGNPHNTQITDITGLKTKVDTIDTKLVKTLDDGNRNQYRIAMYAKQGTYGVVHTNRSDVSLNGTLQSGSFSISAGDVITMPGDNSIPIVNGVSLTSSNAEITLPLGMIVIANSDALSFTSPSVWKVTIRAATVADTLPIRIAPDNQALSIPLRDGKGRLTTLTPSGNDDLHCVNIDYWKANYKPFNYTTISTLSAVEHGFNVEYQIDGKSAEIEIPLEGTDDIVVDIDETNKMINIHLDAKVRAKLAKMLTLPAEAPAKNSIVGVGTNNAQMIMTEQEARDAISVYKTMSITQTDYDNLAVKDSKTLYLITG